MTLSSTTLRTIPLFASVGEATLERLAAASVRVSLRAGSALLRAGERPECLFILRSGLVELASGDGDSASTIDVLRAAGAYFPLPAVLLDRPTVTTARAITNVDLLGVPAALLRTLLPTDPALASALLRAAATQSRFLIRQTGELKRRTSAQRLGCFLLTLASEQGVTDKVQLPFNKRLLSSCLGVTPEHLSRAFGTLRRCGVTTSGRRTVSLRDTVLLAAFARPDEPLDDGETGIPSTAPLPASMPAVHLSAAPATAAPLGGRTGVEKTVAPSAASNTAFR